MSGSLDLRFLAMQLPPGSESAVDKARERRAELLEETPLVHRRMLQCCCCFDPLSKIIAEQKTFSTHEEVTKGARKTLYHEGGCCNSFNRLRFFLFSSYRNEVYKQAIESALKDADLHAAIL